MNDSPTLILLNLMIWPCWFQSMSAVGSRVLKFILFSFISGVTIWEIDVSGPFTSCQHHTNCNNNGGEHNEPHPALTLLPWLEYFFTESARPWTKRRSTLSYSVDAVKREIKKMGVISEKFCQLNFLSLCARKSTTTGHSSRFSLQPSGFATAFNKIQPLKHFN